MCLAALSGCGESGPPLAENVSGRITLGGTPVAEASVQFISDSSGIAVGNTDADGRYTVYFGERQGAPLGQHTVRISKYEGEAGDELIPAKYNINSKLTADVTADGANEFNFELER